jgi:phospholipid/cholesterol/gamma-HCH transport system substrate-binding protein
MINFGIETGVGIFMILGILIMAFISVKLADVNLFGTKQYSVKARVTNISGLKEGAIVEVAVVVRAGKIAAACPTASSR